MKAVIYLRISADRTGDELGITRQREDCERLVTQRGWELIRTYSENDTSAAGKKQRPQWEAMMTAVERGEVQAIVGWTLDRTLRSGRDRLRILEAGKKHSIVISIVRGSDMDLSTPAGRFAADILGAVALNEIEVKSDRQRRAAEQAADQGRWIGGRKPFGYGTDGVTVLEDEADAIRGGYTALLSGASLRAIAAEWNAAGHRTGQMPWKRTAPGGRSLWRADSVGAVLANPRYAGIRTLRRDGRREERGQAEWSPLVELETFRAAERLLADPARRSGGGGGRARQLLTGLALCGCPGCVLTVHGGGAGHGKPIYRCGSSTLEPHARVGLVPGTHVSRLAEPVDDYIEQLVLAWMGRPEVLRRLHVEHTPDVAALRDRAVMLRRRLEQMATEFGQDEGMSPAELRAMRAPVVQELREVDAALADAGRVDALNELALSEDIAARWAELDVDRKQLVIGTLMVVRLRPVGRGTRTFRPETVEIEWR